MEYQALITAFFTLFVIIDPIGLAPIFVALCRGMSPVQRRSVALRAVMIGALLLTLFGFFGEAVLGFAGISMPAFRIAGGILLFLTALDMLFERRTKRRKSQTSEDDDPSVFPLATPLIAGPGAIATMILLMDQAEGALETGMVLLMLAAVLVLVLVMALLAPLLEKALGQTGTNVVTRLLGMLLAALSVQFIADGIIGFIPAVPG
ncbi:MarC family protein [Candidatus Halocynthiibacter alkanivorans]|uniref:MarC family protein n=1 Tax=Candidatus Halocynthiibacter alkanivorans TaxID=2267619 RepID=UPI00190F623C|nr:MarC family protein [Candidatus Halocynthiibacter alkanivorans]